MNEPISIEEIRRRTSQSTEAAEQRRATLNAKRARREQFLAFFIFVSVLTAGVIALIFILYGVLLVLS